MKKSHNEKEVQLKRLKNKKCPGENDIWNEEWKNSSQNIWSELITILKKIWDGSGLPESLRKGDEIRPTRTQKVPL